MSDALLHVENLSKRYGSRTVVDGLSFDVFRGDVFGFLGPNGAGKSTTLRMLLGLIRPNRGTVQYFGEPFDTGNRDPLKRIGALIEKPAVYEYMSARENLEIFSDLSGGVPTEDIDAVLEKIGLARRADDIVRTFSQGMRQRLGIGLALLPKPELLILDEPTNGLDVHGMRDVRELIVRLNKDDGLTVIVSSHLLVEIRQVCNRMVIIDHGKTVLQGAVDEALGSEKTVFVRAEPRPVVVAQLDSFGGLTYTEENGGFSVSGSTLDVAELNARLVSGGCRVEELRPTERDLEALFLELTENTEIL